MKLCVLGSGSRGNSIYVEAGKTRVLFDAGFSTRQIKRRLASVGVDPVSLSAVVISHEHSDHIAGLLVLGKKLPVYATGGTLEYVSRRYELCATERIEPGEWRRIGDLEFLPVPLSHDAAEPVGFIVSDGMKKAGILTDQGVVTSVIRHHFTDLACAVVEANHDPRMLLEGPYTWELKQRIKSRQGHLANAEAAQVVAAMARTGLRRAMLAHLSETNNLPRLALAASQRAVDGLDVSITACSQHRPAGMIRV